MLLQTLRSAAVIHPPRWLVDNTAHMTVMGSQSYGVPGDAPDVDIHGFCIPPNDMVLPHPLLDTVGLRASDLECST